MILKVTKNKMRGSWIVDRRSKNESRTTIHEPRFTNPGFTLIELLVTLAVVGLIMGLVIGQVGKMMTWDMKAQARKLASTIRYLYNKAGTEGVTLRLVFDIDAGSYSVESTSEHFTLAKEEEDAFAKKRDSSLVTRDSEEKKRTTDHESRTTIQPKEASFGPEESYLLKSVQLPKGVYFKDIYAEHQIDVLSSGKAYVYFFPQGYVERSVINLRDANDAVHFSLTVNPISGSVKIEAGYKEPEIER